MRPVARMEHSENKDHGIRSHHFIGNRWGNSGNSVRLYFFGSNITADGDCSHEIKRRLLFGRKIMTNLDSISKSRDITLPTKCESVVAQSCLTLCDPMDCSLRGSSLHGIFQGRVPEWVTSAFSYLDSILKSKDITLSTKVRLIKAMVFPAVMCGCESWTIKKAEHRRINVFALWCWRRLLRVPWTLRRSNQPNLKEINPEYFHWKD